MRWYQGGIAEAIAVSKRKGAVFVVYIEGEDEKSGSITKSIDSDAVSQKLQSDSFVAIKLEANSLPHKQFIEIYKDASVPSIFFIGKTGIPLEIVRDIQDSSTLAQTVEKVLEKSGAVTTGKQTQSFLETERTVSSTVPTTSHNQTEKPVDLKQENTEISSSSKEDVVCENGVCYKKTPEKSSSPDSSVQDASSNENLSADEKIERAKELVEKRRLEKEKEEEEKEKQKEIERREMGKNVQQMKRRQEDQEMKQLKEEREREKRENQAARDRVLAQIAQDKAERAAKFSNSPPKADQPPSTSSTPPEKKTANSNISRLQFKLPDGITHTHEFQSSDTLEKVRDYIQSTLNMSSSFTLSTSFPRREFTANDNSQTLLDLQLVPNAVLLVLRPSSGPVTQGGGGGLMGMFWFILTPVISVLNYFKHMLGFDRNNRSNQERNKRPADNSEPSSRSLPKRPRDTTVIRKQGNVHRLTDKGDSDDENNTWNGNSTQQM